MVPPVAFAEVLVPPIGYLTMTIPEPPAPEAPYPGDLAGGPLAPAPPPPPVLVSPAVPFPLFVAQL